jgi:hypothetical protein
MTAFLRDTPRVAAYALVGATLLLVALEVAPAWNRVHDAAARNEAFTPDQRRIVSAYGLDISREFVLAAMRLLPEDATYAVVTGDNVQVSTPLSLSALPPYARFLLLPRRQLPFFTQDAQYLLCYGCDLDEQQKEGALDVLWDDEPGTLIARRRP